MATVSRPNQPPAAPTGGEDRGASGGAGGGAITWPRVLALGGLGLVVLIVAYVLFSGGSSARYYLFFKNGSLLVRGDEVQVGGVSVGNVKNIELTSSLQPRVTIEVESSLLPLHQGTTAQVRNP